MSERFDLAGCLHSTNTISLDQNSVLGLSNFRSDHHHHHHHQSHVAQQSRRDKLRVPNTTSLSSTTHLHQDFGNHHLLPARYSSTTTLNPDFVQVRNNIKNCDLLYDPTITMFPSEMLNFSNQHVLHQESDADHSGKLSVGPDINSSISSSSSHVVPTNLRFLQSQQQQQQSCDWMSSFVSGGGGGSVCNENPSSILIGEILPPRNAKETDFSSVVAPVYLKPEYQDVQSSLTNNRSSDISNQGCQKTYGEITFRSPLFYQTNLQQVVTSSSTLGTQGFEMGSGASLVQQQKIRETGHGSWVDDGGNENELVLLPTTYGNQNDHPSHLMERGSSSSTHEWNGHELGFSANNKSGGNLESVVGDSTTQGLSLSLSSYPPPPEFHAPQFGERFVSENLQTRPAAICSETHDQDSKPNNSGCLLSNSKSSINIANKGFGNSVEGIIGGCSTAYARHCTGPLGPFTGYATILKNSKFLKPAQQLLEEFCSLNGTKIIKPCEVVDKSSRDVSMFSDPVNSDNGDGGSRSGSGRDGNSGVSSTFFSSNAAAAGGEGRMASGSCQSYRPDFQQKKAKLMYMLEEVCRRYKQYHQQMQMVVSSFESVAGLDAATPYTSLALKTVSKHFRSLKNTIADQLKMMRKALGEDMSSPTSGTNSNKGDATVPRLRFMNQSLGKQAASGNSIGFLEPQQHVWRPQRGLPERSVAVLKAWLFEHFLHPYPTDTDKHMLASQTGLTRNQVSNWFINARVRVWKPMVEEMHMLETKGSTEMDLNSGKSTQKQGGDSSGRNTSDQSSNMLMINAMSEKVPECSMVGGLTSEVGQSSENLHQEKRSRMECQIQTGVLDGGLMGFVPYNQRGLEIGGLGSVSLTLGLRHSTGNVQQQHHADHQLNRHYGSQMLHDFVG